MYIVSQCPHLSLSQLQVAKVASKLQSLPQAPSCRHSAQCHAIWLCTTASICLWLSVHLPECLSWLFFCSVPLSIPLFLLYLSYFFILLSDFSRPVSLLFLTCMRPLSLLFTVNLCLVRTKYKYTYKSWKFITLNKILITWSQKDLLYDETHSAI